MNLTPNRLRSQTLLIDADDTLWENNIYFERAIASFFSWLNHPTHTTAELRERLNACERATIAAHGYGLTSFRRSLTDCYEQLAAAPISAEDRDRIHSFTESIAAHPIDFLPGVAESLPILASRHRLLLVTKGNHEEQTAKLDRSGLAEYFSGVEVLPEKHEAAYRALAVHHRCDAATTWMIGNSPRSDINPALAAGLHAVFLPHAHTWALEHETLDPTPSGQTLLELPTFAHLIHHF